MNSSVNPTLCDKIVTVLPPSIWRERERIHRESLAPWLFDIRERRARSLTHPVADFLFTYYQYPPGKLERWHPDLEEALEDDGSLPSHFLSAPYIIEDGLVKRDPSLMSDKVPWRAEWILNLCLAILNRPARYSCFGLHEWAMVYRLTPEEIRHAAHPLRLEPGDLATFVEEQALVCTHYDAFRFFTPFARPLNAWAPTLETRPDWEQGGCIHANMDLYKWAYKLMPWLGGDLLRETFLLAAEARETDMRASPYDLRALGYEPIPIETTAGRRDYEQIQRTLAAKAGLLRRKLADHCQRIMKMKSS